MKPSSVRERERESVLESIGSLQLRLTCCVSISGSTLGESVCKHIRLADLVQRGS